MVLSLEKSSVEFLACVQVFRVSAKEIITHAAKRKKWYKKTPFSEWHSDNDIQAQLLSEQKGKRSSQLNKNQIPYFKATQRLDISGCAPSTLIFPPLRLFLN